MDLNLPNLATQCAASGRAFAEGDTVASILGRDAAGAVVRLDVLESEESRALLPPTVYCRWLQEFKPRPAEENADRLLKLTAENLFITLCSPPNVPEPGNTPLIQFLALMLERKKLLRPRGQTEDGERVVYEHAGTHDRYEVPAADFTPEFFVKVQEQLGVLVGSPAPATPPVETPSEAEAK
jgi:hypothetical protein